MHGSRKRPKYFVGPTINVSGNSVDRDQTGQYGLVQIQNWKSPLYKWWRCSNIYGKYSDYDILVEFKKPLMTVELGHQKGALPHLSLIKQVQAYQK